jgi:hypothetical protein
LERALPLLPFLRPAALRENPDSKQLLPLPAEFHDA